MGVLRAGFVPILSYSRFCSEIYESISVLGNGISLPRPGSNPLFAQCFYTFNMLSDINGLIKCEKADTLAQLLCHFNIIFWTYLKVLNTFTPYAENFTKYILELFEVFTNIRWVVSSKLFEAIAPSLFWTLLKDL